MKLRVTLASLLLVTALGFVRTASADTVSSGGVSYTLTNEGSDSSHLYDVLLTINTSGAHSSASLNSFSLAFLGALNVVLESAPSGAWTVAGTGSASSSGCNLTFFSNSFCIDGGTIPISTHGGGAYSFLFDVQMITANAPILGEIQALPGTRLSISSLDRVGPMAATPEPPAYLFMLGAGLVLIAKLLRPR